MEMRNDGDKMDLVRAAAFIGISPHTLRAWTRERRIPFHRCGRRIVFTIADLKRFWAASRVEARTP